MIPANDNDKRWSLRPLRPWGHYQKLGFTCFGPIGITDGTFEYLDCEIAEQRAY